MITAKRRSYLITLPLAIVTFLLSFRSFAAYLDPDIDSDQAVHILMAYHLELPQDLYYWGQNRLGSLVPILGHALFNLVPISAAQAVSYVQYFLLAFGFLCLASLFQSAISRIMFACIWFIPLPPFKSLLLIAQPYGVQFAFIGFALLMMQLAEDAAQVTPIKRQVFISLAIVSLFISLWVSDLTILPMFLLVLVGLKSVYMQIINASKSRLQETILVSFDLLNIAIVSLLSLLFIRYAKQHAVPVKQYGEFNTLTQTLEVITKLTNSLVRTIAFQAKNTYLSIHAILVVILLSYIVYLVTTGKIKQDSFMAPRWFYLFLANTIAGLILLVTSHWVYSHALNLRYFTFVYISLWLTVLLFAESLSGILAKRVYTLLLLITLCSTLSLSKTVFAMQKPESEIQRMQQLSGLGRAGLIGHYWNSYVLCAANPAELDCTPRDRQGKFPCLPPGEPQRRVTPVRCLRCVEKVLASETIYLVKEDWFRTFPAEIQQFRQCLVKVGEPREIAGYTIARYRLREKSIKTLQP